MQYKSTWHFLHLVMTMLTGGFWILIWIYCALANADHNRRAAFEAQVRK